MQLLQIHKKSNIFYEDAKHLALGRNARIPTLKELIEIMKSTIIERENGTSVKGRLAFIEKYNEYLPCFTSTFVRVEVLDISTYGQEIMADVWNDGDDKYFSLRILNNPSLEENFFNEERFGLPILFGKERGYPMAFNTVTGFNGPIRFHPYNPIIASGVHLDGLNAVLGIAAADAAVL